jgi:NADH-quinone oxidoreductase subunit C
MSKALLDLVQAEFAADIVATHNQHGDETAIVRPEAWFKIHQFLREDARASIDMLSDLTAVDYPDREPRFEVVSHLTSLGKGHRLRLKTRVGDSEGETVEVASLTALWASANWMEREAYDMFGVRFIGHPDLRRILMYPEFEGHPLRKDYPADKIQPLVPFREVSGTEKVAPFGPDEGMSFGRQTFDKQAFDKHRDDN